MLNIIQNDQNIIHCDRCGKFFTRLTSLRTHFNNKKTCKPLLKDISIEELKEKYKVNKGCYKCENCGKEYKTASGKCKHKKKCILNMELIEKNEKYELKTELERKDNELDELKKQLYLAMVNVNLLEGLRFYVSFACTFAFGELKLMEGSAKILSLIARDEATHLNLSTHVIKAWQKGDDKGMSKVMKGLDKTVIEMFKKCVEEEKAWAKHLFKDGSIIGLNERLLGTYVEWIANKRLRALGFDPLYDVGANQNPLPWTQHWLSSKGLQVAPQETEVESYLIGGIKQDVQKGQFKKFSL